MRQNLLIGDNYVLEEAIPQLVRLATRADAAQVRDIYAHYVEKTAVSFESEAPGLEEMRHRMAKTLERFPFLVFEEDGLIKGYAYASAHHMRACYRWSIDVSVYVLRDHHRQGIGRKLYGPLLDCVRELGYGRAHAGITLPNEASVGLHESFGFRPVGVYDKVGYKFGKWHDVGWWQLRLQHLGDQPEEPRLFVR